MTKLFVGRSTHPTGYKPLMGEEDLRGLRQVEVLYGMVAIVLGRALEALGHD